MSVDQRIKVSFAVGLLLVVVGTVLGTQSQSSIPWTWKYTGEGIEAHGTFVTSESRTVQGSYSILSINGNRNGIPIVSLYPVGTPIPGNAPYNVDNLVSFKVPQLSNDGIGYGLANGVFCSPFHVESNSTYLEFYSAPPIGENSEAKGPEDTENPINFEAKIVTTFDWSQVPLGLGLLNILRAGFLVASNKLRSKGSHAEKPSSTDTKR